MIADDPEDAGGAQDAVSEPFPTASRRFNGMPGVVPTAPPPAPPVTTEFVTRTSRSTEAVPLAALGCAAEVAVSVER